MSVIFPQSPAQVTVHHTPKNSEMVTYSVGDNITISAWMPDSFQRINQEREMTHDDFYHNHCDGCPRNCYSFLEEYFDEESGEVCWDDVPGGYEGHCNVYDDGYSGQYCPEGYIMVNEDVDFMVSNMVFEITLSHIGNSKRFSYVGDSTYLAAGKYEDGKVTSTLPKMAANVFGYEENPEGICWGYNDKPYNLREIVTEYFSTPFNSDLTTIETFEDNCDLIKYRKETDCYFEATDKKYLCENADALILVDAGENVTAFFHLLSAGYTSIPEAPHIMILPVYQKEIEKNGNSFNGYVTQPDAVGKSWFLTTEGLLVGQV